MSPRTSSSRTTKSTAKTAGRRGKGSSTRQSTGAANGEPTTARGRNTLAALIRSAREIFERDGFIEARITDIVDNAGAAYGSFYTYFDSKEAIFREVALSVVRDMFDASYAALDAESGGDGRSDPFTRMEQANRAYLEAYKKNAKIYVVIHQMATFNEFTRELWRDIRATFIERAARGLTHLQEAGQADRDIDPVLAASLLGGMVEHYAYLALALGDGDSEHDEDTIVRTITTLWANAVGLRPAGPSDEH